MEKDLKEEEEVEAIVTNEENASSRKTLATIYCTCNGSKLFDASRSSFQTNQPVDQCSLNFSGLKQPNFCELDIITKNKRVVNTVIKFAPLQTTSAKLKVLPMVNKIPGGRSRAFRRTIGDPNEKMTHQEKPSEVLHLEKILLKNRDSLSDGALEKIKPPIRRRAEKTKERKSKPAIAEVTSFIDNQEIVKKFDDLENAKTMYFVDLPNKKVNGTDKKKTKKSNLGVETGNTTKRKNANATSECVVEKNIKKEEATISKPIIINRIENDVSQWNSVNSQSTLCDTTKEGTVSEISVDCSFRSSKKSKERIHNNSPTSDVTIQEEIVTVKPSRKRKIPKKRHENSEEDVEKIEGVKEERSTRRKHRSAGTGEKKNQKAEEKNDEIKRDSNVPRQNAQEKRKNGEEVKKMRHSKKRSYPKQAAEEQASPQKNWETKSHVLKENNVAEENNPQKNKSQDEIKVIFKDKRQEVDGRRRPKTAQANHTKLEVASTVASENTSGMKAMKKNDDADYSNPIGAKEKTPKLQPAKLLLPKNTAENRAQNHQPAKLLPPQNAENDQSKSNSVLKLYFVEKLAPSTSSLKLTDDLLSKLKAEKRKRASLRSKRPPAPTPNQGEKQKRRSKSRVTKEKVCTSKGGEDNVEQRKSRKSASDVSKKRLLQNFDISAFVEGRKMGLPPKLIRPKKSRASLSLSTTTFENHWPKGLPGKASHWSEGVSTITEKYLRKTVRQVNRKWSKSCTRKQYELVCQYSEEENKTKSDTSVNWRKTESVAKAHAKSVLPPTTQIKSPKEKIYEELCKLGAQKNLIRSSNRFRVTRVSSTTNKNINESQASDVTRSYKLKPRPSSEKEKEAILNLFKQNNTVGGTSSEVRKKRRPKQIRERNKDSNSTSEEEAMFRSLNEKSSNRKKRMRKCLFRKEVSFTQLNVTPVQELYRERSLAKTLPEVLFSRKVERASLALGGGKKVFAYKSQRKEQRPLQFKKEKKNKDVEEKNACSRKLSFFHMVSGEKILEISTRAAANDGNATVGFTVSGTEPPRRLRNDGDVDKSVSEKSQGHLHMTFLAPIEVNESFGFGLPPTKNKEDVGGDCCESLPPDFKIEVTDDNDTPSAHLKRKKASPLITYRRVSKVCSQRKRYFRSLGKRLARATKFVGKQKHYQEERPNGFGKRGEAKREDHNHQFCSNRFKLQAKPISKSGLLQSSTLQIIKEESHSTDSSRHCGNRRDQTENPPAASPTNIKDTQTDFESNDDIVKMKEVINYLYSAIEQSKNLNVGGGAKTSEKHLQTEKCLDSSTETSSCCEGRKLNRFKKIIKLSSSSQKGASSKPSKNEEAKRAPSNELTSPVTTTGSSSYGNTSSTSNSKKSPSTGQSSSSRGEVFSSSYFQKYKATKALTDSKRAKKKTKVKLEAKLDKALLGGNFEPLTVINDAKVECTTKVLVDQEQNTSEKLPSFVELAEDKTSLITKFEDKSLQTSDAIVQHVESHPKSDEGVYGAEQNPSNSTNSDGNAIVEKFAKPPKEKTKQKKKPAPSTFERLKRVFGTKVTAYDEKPEDDSDVKLVSGRRQSLPVVDYTSFIKFERHLEQVLGLYPSIFKAIRAQMDVAFANTNAKTKEKTSDLFQSKSTLATTVDTVTEYKNTERYENPPNSINDCLEHCCNCYHVWHKKYVVQQYMDSRDFATGLRSRKHEQRRKIEESRVDKYDSSSSTKPNVEERRPKKSRGRKQNFEETCGLHSLTSVYSNDKGFLSSCSSISLEEKWSVASPLYGRTSSCEDLSAGGKDASASSQSLKIHKIALPSEARGKSKSLIEVSTKKSVNRKLTLKQLLNEQGGNLMQALSGEGHPNILLMSVSSSCTVFTTPSKFLAKVEKHLQIEKTPSPPPETESKIVANDVFVLPPIEDLPRCTTPRVDEKSYRKILFPNTARHLKINSIPKANRPEPFYIHNPSEDNSEQEPDSLEVASPQVKDAKKKEEEEEDFSADSLEVIKQRRSPPKTCNYNMLYSSTTYVKPANQTYLVYSNTVQYDKKLSSTKHASKHRDADKKRRSTGVSDQNVSTTLISESGYESTKSKRTASIRNFFKKGGSLLEMFRSSIKTTSAKTQAGQNLTSFSKLGKKKEGAQTVAAPKKDAATSSSVKDKSAGADKTKVYWHSLDAKDKKVGRHEKKAAGICNKTERQSKCPPEVIRSFPTSPLGFSLKNYKKQKDECHAYAEKVLLESQLRKEGYYKQYRDFKEMPLELLLGKKMPCKPKHQQQTNFVQASPKSTPMSIQTEAASAKENKEMNRKSAGPKAFVAEEKIVLQSDVAKTSAAINTRQSKEDATAPSLDFNSRSKKEVRIQRLEEKESLGFELGTMSSSTSSRLVITKSKSRSSAKELDKSKLCTSSFQMDPDGSTRNPVDLNSNTPSEESSDGFHELYVNSSRLPTQLMQPESDDFKSKTSEESFGKVGTRSKIPKDARSVHSDKSKSDRSFKSPFNEKRKRKSIAETSEVSVSKSRSGKSSINSNISKRSKSKALNRELYASDSSERQRSSLEEIDLKAKRKRSSHEELKEPDAPERCKSTVAVAEINQIRFRSRSNTSGEYSKSHASDSERQRSSLEEINLKSKRKRSAGKDLAETDATERRESTVVIADINQIRFRSRPGENPKSHVKEVADSGRQRRSPEKTNLKSESKRSFGKDLADQIRFRSRPRTASGETSKSKGTSKSTSTRRWKRKSKEMKYNCRCKEESLDEVRDKNSMDSFTSEVVKQISVQEVPDAETDTLFSVPFAPPDEDANIGKEVDTTESGTFGSSIVDVVVSKSVTGQISKEVDRAPKDSSKGALNSDDINLGEAFKPQIHEHAPKESSEGARSADDINLGEAFKPQIHEHAPKESSEGARSADDINRGEASEPQIHELASKESSQRARSADDINRGEASEPPIQKGAQKKSSNGARNAVDIIRGKVPELPIHKRAPKESSKGARNTDDINRGKSSVPPIHKRVPKESSKGARNTDDINRGEASEPPNHKPVPKKSLEGARNADDINRGEASEPPIHKPAPKKSSDGARNADDINQGEASKPQIHERAAKEPPEVTRNISNNFRKGLTDKEVFEKLLESYEKKDTIAARLSKDDDFFNSQIDSLQRQSVDSIGEQARKGSKVYSDDPHRSTHFWEEKMRQMRTKEDNPVKADDIGVCFARGFRPDNITLSGDACFNLNKQDRLTFSARMLSDQESIIDFSERETPLDYLLALGFMVDEASNALKDEDIRSRLLAAITEARVWVNKITTTQGTLLYLVAYKSRPKTMRYFLQLVEAIINRRINNAIMLDGFLRILEQVEEGEIQMINILGAEKFEDEESEEKIVRKQLKQLFITVYKIAEHESFQRGKPLSQESIFLLRILAAKYRAGLHPHLELIARYIGQELLTTETQLEAAMIFLSRLDTAEVKLKEFEAYCDIRCEKKKKTEEKDESADNEKTAGATKSSSAEKAKSIAAKIKSTAGKTKRTEKAKTAAKSKSKK